MSERAYKQLTLFPEDSHVSLFRLPGSEEAWKMTVSSGQKCSELFRSCSPLGLLVRTCLGSSIWRSTRCLLTWKPSVTKRKRLYFRLVASVRGTVEKGSAFWPTLTANGLGSEGHRKMLRRLVEAGMLTEAELRAMVCGHGGRINPIWAEWFQGYVREWTGLIPTPEAANSKSAPRSRFIGGGGDTERICPNW